MTKIFQCVGRTVATAASLILLSSCASSPKPSTPPAGAIVKVNIMTMPVGLNLDGRPGIDGFSAKVYANDARNPKPIPIREGQLEVIAWDGSLFGRTNLPPALHTWTFQASEIRRFEFQAGIGTGYEFSLLWGTNQPTKSLITVAARYTALDGRTVVSSPSSVTVINK